MSPEQIIELARECGAIVGPNYAPTMAFVRREQIKNFTDRIAQQAIAEHLAKLQGDWLRSGDLLYRPGEGQSVINKDMIQVMVADGSYGLGKRADAAAVLHKLLDAALPAKQQESAPVLPELPNAFEMDWPHLNAHALGCGVEDRGIRDRYDAANYGWEDGVERCAERFPDDLYTADQMHEYALAAIAAGGSK